MSFADELNNMMPKQPDMDGMKRQAIEILVQWIVTSVKDAAATEARLGNHSASGYAGVTNERKGLLTAIQYQGDQMYLMDRLNMNFFYKTETVCSMSGCMVQYWYNNLHYISEKTYPLKASDAEEIRCRVHCEIEKLGLRDIEVALVDKKFLCELRGETTLFGRYKQKNIPVKLLHVSVSW